MSSPTTLLVGLSGPSSSGKTTLARLLRQTFNDSASSSGPAISTSKPPFRLFILHEDDFYKTDALIPVRSITSSAHGTRHLQDWDCADSLDIPLLRSTLQHIKEHGTLPEDMFSKEDQNTVGESGVSDAEVAKYTQDVTAWLQQQQLDKKLVICLFDGFLVYPDPNNAPGTTERELHQSLQGLLDLKLFISGTKRLTIERRAKRTGYVTLEGFWADPPGYVEDLVWPNYRRDHAWLFRGEDGKEEGAAVDSGKINRAIASEAGILVGPGDGEAHLKEILPWAIDRLKEAVEKRER